MDKCNKPPSGWVCTRASGHTGPCAAIPLNILDDETAIRLDERITQLQICADITENHDFPEAHFEIVKLLEQAKAEQEAKP